MLPSFADVSTRHLGHSRRVGRPPSSSGSGFRSRELLDGTSRCLIGSKLAYNSVFEQFFGGTIGLAIGQPAFAGELAKNLAKYAPTAPATSLKDNPTLIYSSISDKLRPSVIKAFSESLRVTFLVGLPVGETLAGARVRLS